MRKRTTLSDVAYRQLRPAAPGQRNTYVDDPSRGGGVSGLELRVTERGKKSWSLLFRVRGEDRKTYSSGHQGRPLHRITFGDVLPEKVRPLAREALEQANAGRDPRTERETAAKEQRKTAARTVGWLVNDADGWLALHVRPKLAKAREVERVLERHVLLRWHNRPLAELTRADAQGLIDGVAQRAGPGAAAEVKKHLGSLFEFALGRDLVSANFARVCNVPGKKAPTKGRALRQHEVKALWSAADEAGHPAGALVKLLLLTGCRLNEVAKAEWSWLNEDVPALEIPTGSYKSRRVQVAPLSSLAQEVVATIPREGRYLLSSCHGRAPVSGFSKIKARLDRLSGVKKWTWHDLRRTVASELARLEIDQFVIDRVLGHTLGGVRARYNQYGFLKEKAQALEVWAQELTRWTGGEAKVVPLRSDAMVG